MSNASSPRRSNPLAANGGILTPPTTLRPPPAAVEPDVEEQWDEEWEEEEEEEEVEDDEYNQGGRQQFLVRDPQSPPNPSTSNASVVFRKHDATPAAPLAGVGNNTTYHHHDNNDDDAPDEVQGDDATPEDEGAQKREWGSRMFADCCADVKTVLEVLFCNPCNIAAQLTALDDKVQKRYVEQLNADEFTNAGAEGQGRLEVPMLAHLKRPLPKPSVATMQRRRREPDDTSEDSSSEEEGDATAARARGRRDQPPLDTLPCVSVILMNVICCGMGTPYFSYMIREQTLRKFNINSGMGDGQRRFAVDKKEEHPPPGNDDDHHDGANDDGGEYPRQWQGQQTKRDRAKKTLRQGANGAQRGMKQLANVSMGCYEKFIASQYSALVCCFCSQCQTDRELQKQQRFVPRYLNKATVSAVRENVMKME